MSNIRVSKEEYLDYLGVNSINVSHEYNAFDWPQFLLGGANRLYRAITSKATLRIENPGFLIDLFVGNWTRLGDAINTFVTISNPIELILNGIAASSGKQKNAMTHAFISNMPNIYKSIFIDYKKVNIDDIDKYRQEFSNFKDVIAGVKASICKPISETSASVPQISDLRLFRPKEIEKEMETAIAYYRSKSAEWEKFANGVAQWITDNVVKYLLDNISDPNGYIKKD